MFSFFDFLKKGDHYLKVWPKQHCLYSLFIESKVVCYTQILFKIFPIFIVLIASLYILFPAYFSWPSTATFILFLIGLPTHCLLWLGKRSQQLLSPALLDWYVEVNQVINSHQLGQSAIAEELRFIDLAKLLNKGFKKGGDDFLYNNELI